MYCCGIDGASDWYGTFSTPSSLTSVSVNMTEMWVGPASCCRPRYRNDDTCPKNQVFKDGCLDALTYIVSESALLLGCGALAVAFIQVSFGIL